MHHKTITDGSFYYAWADNKGLHKVPKKSGNGEWDNESSRQIINENADKVREAGFTMFIHKDKLYARNKSIRDAPFR